MKSALLFLFLCPLLLLLPASCNAYRILFLAPFPVPSHWLWLDHFVREMLNRGHHVTALTNFRTKEPHQNYTEFIIDPPYDLYPISPPEWMYEGRYYNNWENLKLLWRVGLPTTKHALESNAGQKLLHDNEMQFDLVISEQFQQEALLLFAHKFNAPLITISTYDISDYLDESKGFRPSLGNVPHILLPYTEDMTFQERLTNIFISSLDKLIRCLYYLPIQNGMARHFFKHEGILPTIQEMEQQIAVTLYNAHPAMTTPRPSMPSHVLVGGVHLPPKGTRKLDESVKEFLDSAEEGVIYISFGSHVQSNQLPKEILNCFIENVKRLPHKILWKFEDEHMENKPENVKLVKWVAQTEVLAHPNVVLFVNHGGAFGTQEGTYYGVPMLTVPFYADQFRNARNVERNGHGLVMNFKEITEEKLKHKFEEILYNPQYRLKADQVAMLFRDNPMKPLDVAMYWIEFVARHKGAPHLQAKVVSFWKYHNIDVFAAIIGGFFATSLVAFISLNKLIGRSKKKKTAKVKRN